MKALWHVVYWPALTVVVLCIIANFCTTLLHSLAQELAEHAEKKLRGQRRPA